MKKDDNYDRYCPYCGAKCRVKIRTIGSPVYFDSMTGMPVKNEPDYVYHYWKCPNKKWFFDNHADFNDVPSDPYP